MIRFSQQFVQHIGSGAGLHNLTFDIIFADQNAAGAVFLIVPRMDQDSQKMRYIV